MPDKKMYAVYGSNLHTAQMSVRCPDAEICGKAELKDYELVFRKNPKYAVANIEPRAGSAVPFYYNKIGWPPGSQPVGFIHIAPKL